VERVVIVGRSGAGKTHVANELARRTGAPVIYLDRIFWREGWRPAPREEALGALEAAVAGERWIVDGNFLETAGPIVFPRADLVVFIDAPRLPCIWNVLARRVRDHGKERPDLPAPETFDWKLLKWVWRWDETERPKLLRLVEDQPGLAMVVAATSDEALARIFADE
jgi:adenylate kinase family enzyme